MGKMFWANILNIMFTSGKYSGQNEQRCHETCSLILFKYNCVPRLWSFGFEILFYHETIVLGKNTL
jgi:hypothetical protein